MSCSLQRPSRLGRPALLDQLEQHTSLLTLSLACLQPNASPIWLSMTAGCQALSGSLHSVHRERNSSSIAASRLSLHRTACRASLGLGLLITGCGPEQSQHWLHWSSGPMLCTWCRDSLPQGALLSLSRRQHCEGRATVSL